MIQITKLITIIYILFFQSREIQKNYVQDLPIDGFSLEMVYIPNGIFNMGKDSTKSMDYSPSNKIELLPFWISKYEITWDIYQLFMDQTNFEEKENFERADFIDEIDGISEPTTPYVDLSLIHI